LSFKIATEDNSFGYLVHAVQVIVLLFQRWSGREKALLNLWVHLPTS